MFVVVAWVHWPTQKTLREGRCPRTAPKSRSPSIGCGHLQRGCIIAGQVVSGCLRCPSLTLSNVVRVCVALYVFVSLCSFDSRYRSISNLFTKLRQYCACVTSVRLSKRWKKDKLLSAYLFDLRVPFFTIIWFFFEYLYNIILPDLTFFFYAVTFVRYRPINWWPNADYIRLLYISQAV